MEKRRIVYMDLAKCVAIMCVCISHSFPMTSIGYDSTTVRFIGSFQMPLFMLMCGFFSISSLHISSAIEFFNKKAKQLLIPVISFTLITCILYYVWNVYGLKAAYKNEAIGSMWFLRTLFFCYTIAYLALKTKLPDYACCLVSCLILMIAPHGYYLQTNYMLLYFWTGYFLNKNWGGYLKQINLITFISAITYALLYFTFSSDTVNIITYETIINSPIHIIKTYLIGLSMSLVIIGICNMISKHSPINNNNLFASIGRYTLGIYGIQTIIIERIGHHYIHITIGNMQIPLYNLLIVPILGIFLCFVSYLIVWLTSRSKILSIYLYGGAYYKQH